MIILNGRMTTLKTFNHIGVRFRFLLIVSYVFFLLWNIVCRLRLGKTSIFNNALTLDPSVLKRSRVHCVLL